MNNMIDRISNFVEGIHMETDQQDTERRRSSSSNRSRQDCTPVRNEAAADYGEHNDSILSAEIDDQQDPIPMTSVMDKADKVVLDAEKIRANLIAPRGMLPINIDSNIELLRNLDNDDDFFHVSCHVDPALKEKIERGDFIDLDKLLPKDKAAGGYSMSEEHQGVQLFTKNGQTFLAPAASEKKISNLKLWDQAFWVYATIYTRANPQRSSEVWQYVHIIHTAAGTYSWSNVSFYDFMFRKLMATKPWHSWVKTYNLG